MLWEMRTGPDPDPDLPPFSTSIPPCPRLHFYKQPDPQHGLRKKQFPPCTPHPSPEHFSGPVRLRVGRK